MVSDSELQEGPICHVWTILCSQLARLNRGGVRMPGPPCSGSRWHQGTKDTQSPPLLAGSKDLLCTLLVLPLQLLPLLTREAPGGGPAAGCLLTLPGTDSLGHVTRGPKDAGGDRQRGEGRGGRGERRDEAGRSLPGQKPSRGPGHSPDRVLPTRSLLSQPHRPL